MTVALIAIASMTVHPLGARAGGGPALDPDATAGLDDPGWVPPPGSIRVATLPSGLGTLPSDATGVVMPQEAGGDGFSWQGRMTSLFSYCVEPSRHDAKAIDMKGCFRVRRFDDAHDQQGNDYVGEAFSIFGDTKGGWKLDRLKGRSEQPGVEAVDWAPGADQEFGNPQQVTVSAGFEGSGVSSTWTVYPGRTHPWVGRSVFHSSWISQNGGAKPGRSIQSLGAAVWRFSPGAAVHGDTGRAEAWLRK